MWRLTLPTCFALTAFLAAWAHPAGPRFEQVHAQIPSTARQNVPSAFAELLAAETTLGRSGTTFRPAPAGNVSVTAGFNPPQMTAPLHAASVAETTADVLAQSGDLPALAPPEPTIELIRLPPHRPIPREIVCETLAAAAASNDLPAPFLIRLIWQESGFNQHAVSPVGAQGVAQFMPATAAERRLDNPFDPLQALHASASLLRDLVRQFGNRGLAAAAYNAGPRRVQDWLTKKGKLPQETRDYVQTITGKPADHWRAAAAAAAPVRIPAAAPCQRQAGLLAANGPLQIPLPPLFQVAKAEAKKETAKQASTAKPAAKLAKNSQMIMAAKSTKPVKLAGQKTAPAKRDNKSSEGKASEHKRVRVAEAARTARR